METRLNKKPDSSAQFDAFLSFAEEDKTLAEKIYKHLSEKGLKIWYSGIHLQVGNSIIEAVNQAISTSKFGIVLLSKHTIENKQQFPLLELNALINKKLYGYLEDILVLYHQVSHQDVVGTLPLVADFFALPTDMDMSLLVDKIMLRISS